MCTGLPGAGRLPALTAAALLALAGSPACGPEEAVHSPETVAVEEKAGDFLDYYEDVLRLARRYPMHPDSFQTALDSLPGSHLSDEEWDAWTAPHRANAVQMAERLEEVIAELARN